MTGKYTINCFQYQEDVRCVCVLNDGITSNDEVCADNYNYLWFKLKGKGRSAGSAATQVQVCGETVVLSQLLLRLAAVHCYGGRCPCCAAPQVLFVD